MDGEARDLQDHGGYFEPVRSPLPLQLVCSSSEKGHLPSWSPAIHTAGVKT